MLSPIFLTRCRRALPVSCVVKAFAQEEEDFKQFEKACENSMEKNLAVVKLRVVFGPALDAVIGISVIVTLLAGGGMVLDGQVSIGQFVAFIHTSICLCGL